MTSRDSTVTPSLASKKLRLAILATLLLVIAVMPQAASSQYAEWRHRGTVVVLATPDGADLPEPARVEGLPVLVRLNKEAFDVQAGQRERLGHAFFGGRTTVGL